MDIGVIGSGMVGQALAGACAAQGHDVVVGTRDPDKLSEWLAGVEGTARVGSFADAAAHGELVIVATRGDVTLAALDLAGADNLTGKVVLDISNPLDFSQGMPPSLFIVNTDSLGEQVQRAHPEARVVKSLNTINASLMVHPRALDDGDHTMFVCGDDADAKATVIDLLHEFGWRDIIDLGDITNARGTEQLLPIWIRLMGTLGTPAFGFKVVR